MAIFNTKTNKPITYISLTEKRIISLQHAIEMALAKGQPSVVAGLDRQLAGAMVSLRRELRRIAAQENG